MLSSSVRNQWKPTNAAIPIVLICCSLHCGSGSTTIGRVQVVECVQRERLKRDNNFITFRCLSSPLSKSHQIMNFCNASEEYVFKCCVRLGPQPSGVLRPEEASQNGAEGGMTTADIKNWEGHFDFERLFFFLWWRSCLQSKYLK